VLNTNTYVTVTGVNTATRTISLSGNGTDLDAWVATSRIFIRGFVGNEMAGMVRVALNTGTLNGISSTTYPEWTATTSTITGALSFEKIMRSMIRSADFGNTGKTKFLVSNGAWMDVMTDLSALRQYADKAKGKLEQGGSDLTFYGPNGMVLEFTPSSMIKNGLAIGYIPEKCARIGTQDDQDSINGSEKTAIFFDLPGYNGAEMRRYWNQSFYTAEPTALVLISGITNKTVPFNKEQHGKHPEHRDRRLPRHARASGRVRSGRNQLAARRGHPPDQLSPRPQVRFTPWLGGDGDGEQRRHSGRVVHRLHACERGWQHRDRCGRCIH
jgi:hypothetical protein